ncbi:MAG TPA: phage recombination protein Bet [Burkholderiales bacterium]|nr:phage recombination protein Bet [Burkholderiales bacterium]
MNAPSTALALAGGIPALHMDETELCTVLQNSIYPGAKLESIKLVVGYCRAQQLDPLQKPVHIVPMDVNTGKKDQKGDAIYEKRDVVMPGIGLYRTNAARTGLYAGKSEPVFGPLATLEFEVDKWVDVEGSDRRRKTKEKAKLEYPTWCSVTVEKLVDGQVRQFTAREFWIENYATAGNWTTAPNKMWRKRPYGQLAKCAEAQALRMAFPDAVGAAPTAEEMEGKHLDDDGYTIDVTPASHRIEQPTSTGNDSDPALKNTQAHGPAESGAGSEPSGDKKDTAKGKPLTGGAVNTLQAALQRAGRGEADLIAAGFGKIAELTFDRFNEVMDWIKANPATA